MCTQAPFRTRVNPAMLGFAPFAAALTLAFGLIACSGATKSSADGDTGTTSASGATGTGSTGTSGGTGTTGASGSSGSSGGAGGSAGTGGSGGSGASGGSGGSGSGSGGSAGSGGSGSGGSGGNGGSGGSGGTGGSGSSGGSSGGGSTPHVLQSFTMPERLGGGSSASPLVFADMAVDAKGNIDITTQSKPLDPDYTSLFLRISPGATAVTARTSLGPGEYPQVAGDPSGNVYVTWIPADVSSSGDFIYSRGVFSRSTDGGASFPGPTPVFTQGGSPHMALDAAADIFVVWNGDPSTSTSPGIFVNRSTDSGKTFSTAMALSDLAKTALAPHIAINTEGKIDVIWQYNSNGQACDSSGGFGSCSPCDIWFTQSGDGGKSFSAPVNVSQSTGCAGLDSTYIDEQQMQIEPSGNLNLVWDDSISGVMFSRSTDGGSNFSRPTLVSPSQGVFPRIAVDASGNINVVWQPASGGGFFFSRSPDGGVTFSSPMQLADGGSANFYDMGTNPFVGTDSNGDIDVAWVDKGTARFSQSFDGGKTFSSPIDVNSTSDVQANSVVQMVVESGGDVDLVIEGPDPTGTGATYIWFTRGGTSNMPPLPPTMP
jgi:hypothetical protein